jgi:hypothetical protein
MMHTIKKKKRKKDHDTYKSLVAAQPKPPPNKTTGLPKKIFKKASQKGTVLKRHRRPISNCRFSPRRKSKVSKQCIQQGSFQFLGTTNEGLT